ncbi:FtsQ-type POTRA domain-containing protein [Rummeliibacillus sp. G93]|uniref:cell division protein FtsQ/DivIB n=1 Tax=Rummeliibacillus TaxID=648802 RepID=UPI00201CAABF|nr:cell division protein FtsQ/DivIB [Rummeliibacillus sp. G93]UQW98301.1 FtsQ-type POTRA domain-containing protein [Rummeliibacillus sp. G93]
MDKVIDIEERIPTLRERRKKRTNRRFIILIVIFLITLLTLLYFQSPYSHIGRIKVEGNHLQSKDYYIKHSGLKKGNSLWDFKSSKIEGLIKSKQIVKSVEVKRSWLNTVTLSIKEHKDVAFLKENDQYSLVLDNGQTLRLSKLPTRLDMPILVGFENKKTRVKMIRQLKQLSSELTALISQVNLIPNDSNPYAIQMFMNDGFEVRGSISSLASKLKFYPSIISQIKHKDKGVIDLEVGTFYRSYRDEYSKK